MLVERCCAIESHLTRHFFFALPESEPTATKTVPTAVEIPCGGENN